MLKVTIQSGGTNRPLHVVADIRIDHDQPHAYDVHVWEAGAAPVKHEIPALPGWPDPLLIVQHCLTAIAQPATEGATPT